MSRSGWPTDLAAPKQQPVQPQPQLGLVQGHERARRSLDLAPEGENPVHMRRRQGQALRLSLGCPRPGVTGTGAFLQPTRRESKTRSE